MRCYEFYCAVLTNPAFCEDKSDRMEAYIYAYVKIMQEKGVKFDKSAEDKVLFLKLQEKGEVGSEYAATQPRDMSESGEKVQELAVVQSETHPPVCVAPTPTETPIQIEEKPLPHPIHCSQPNCNNGTWYPQTQKWQTWQDKPVCPSCYENLSSGEKKMPKTEPEAPRIETSVIKPKDTWEHRLAIMQVPVSKMEIAVLSKLEQKGVHPEVQKDFCLRSTRPDYYFPQQNVAVYLDGEVHKGREDRDEELRGLLTKRYKVRVVTIKYEGSSEATEDGIVQQIMEAI